MKTSIIIPSFGRSSSVVQRTIDSILAQDEYYLINVIEIIVVDQNPLPLDIHIPESTHLQLKHINQIRASVTIAKNTAIKMARGELLYFLDDDVSLQKGCLENHLEIHKNHPKVGLLCGREIIDPPQANRSALRHWLVKIMNLFHSNHQRPNIGTITPKSFFITNFSYIDPNGQFLFIINTVRGCNASVKKDLVQQLGGFDERYQGCALREESDLSKRIENAGFINYYNSKAVVLHHRQLGGCNNLSQSTRSILSKLENERLFQFTHYSHVSWFFFYLRTLPWALEAFKQTWGASILMHAQFAYSFYLLQKGKIEMKDFLPV